MANRIPRGMSCLWRRLAPPSSSSSSSSFVVVLQHHRRFQTTHTLPTCAAEEYVFPVSRALMHLRFAQHWFRRHEEADETRALLQQCGLHVEDDEEEDDVRHVVGTGAEPSRCYDDERHEACVRFCRYHAHHVVCHYKRCRRRWAGGPPPSMLHLSTHMFAAALVLHLSGLLGCSDTHVEPLLAQLISATIFMSQHIHNTTTTSSTHHHHRHHHEKHKVSDIFSEEVCRNLHWCVVHFCCGASSWGLTNSAATLVGGARLRQPLVHMLRATAHVVAPLVHDVGVLLQDDWHRLLSLGRGGNNDVRDDWVAGQSRVLQLLPLMWLSLLCAWMHHHESSLSCIPTQHIIEDVVADASSFTWRAVRHAFSRVLLMYSENHPPDVLLWSVCAIIFMRNNNNNKSAHHQRVHAVEIGAAIAKMEQQGIIRREDLELIRDDDGQRRGDVRRCMSVYVPAEMWLRAAASVRQDAADVRVPTSPRIRCSKDLYLAIINIPRTPLVMDSSATAQHVLDVLLLRVLLQWRRCALPRPPSTSRSLASDVRASKHDDAWLESLFFEELQLMCRAALHLRNLLRTADNNKNNNNNTHHLLHLVADSLMSGMAQQLWLVWLPQRVAWMKRGGPSMSVREQRVLNAAKIVVRDVDGGRSVLMLHDVDVPTPSS